MVAETLRGVHTKHRLVVHRNPPFPGPGQQELDGHAAHDCWLIGLERVGAREAETADDGGAARLEHGGRGGRDCPSVAVEPPADADAFRVIPAKPGVQAFSVRESRQHPVFGQPAGRKPAPRVSECAGDPEHGYANRSQPDDHPCGRQWPFASGFF